MCSSLRSLSLELYSIKPACLINLPHLTELFYSTPTKKGEEPPSYEEFPQALPQLKLFNGKQLGRS